MSARAVSLLNNNNRNIFERFNEYLPKKRHLFPRLNKSNTTEVLCCNSFSFSIAANVLPTTISLTGTKGQTKPLVLEKLFYNAFWAAYKDKYVMEAEDVGEILMIKVKNDQSGFFHYSSDLFLDEVSINYESDAKKVYEFPCFCWVQTESVFFEGKGM